MPGYCSVFVLLALNLQKRKQEVVFGLISLSIHYHAIPPKNVQFHLFSYFLSEIRFALRRHGTKIISALYN